MSKTTKKQINPSPKPNTLDNYFKSDHLSLKVPPISINDSIVNANTNSSYPSQPHQNANEDLED
jgi:hypothetical protein